ncbi:transporter substrate-binding domain-containing protein [Pseudoduganella sp. DS3]|uniref:Transporter substrate-binding domain-containing protein n=1 Tax=Pseudoduganella guangdongensis TaxID=2692179 RepID=A0A6N9HD24_9BURK|nr:transporter substrate-binding domain-containing protein [Pseudoduganella guangdongensis]MYN01147.1 transporter substrate-binding domain-containing protein [Pseudoduganella guangdongensis]
MLRRRILVGLALAAILPAVGSQPLRDISISTLIGTDPATVTAEQIVREAYRRLGINLVLHHLPGERSLVQANDGKMDGELYRKLGMEREYPNLVIVPVPLQIYEIVIFSRGTSFVVSGWDSLRPYTLGFVRGIKIVQENTHGMKIEAVATMPQAFEKMMMGRTDLVLGNRSSGIAVIKALNLEGISILEPPLASFPVYHYVHKKHESLVPELTRILRQMQTDKTIERIQKSVLP